MKEERLIWIIGANSDIAKQFLLTASNPPEKYLLSARTPSKLNVFLTNLSIKPEVTAVDLCCPQQLLDIYALYRGRITGIVFFAGLLTTPDVSPASIQQLFQVNALSLISLLEVVKEDLKIVHGSFVMAVTSIAGERGKVSNMLYGAGKAALSTYLQGLAQELVPFGVRVFDIKPGFVKTKMTAHDPRIMQFPFSQTPEQIAKVMCRTLRLSRSTTVYTSLFWRGVSLALKAVPAFLYNQWRY